MHSPVIYSTIKAVVRYLTRWAWTHEVEATEGIAKLKSMNLEEGKMDLAIQTDPALAQYIAKCFISLVAESPNYTELKYDLVGKWKGEFEWITLLIKKGSGKTPHQLRTEAEKERDKLRNEIRIKTVQ